MFVTDTMGELVDITGSDPVTGNWQHKAFIPAPLSSDEPPLSGGTYRMVAAAGRALAALDATGQQLPNPYLLRTPSLRREAQSTSALEGTYAPLREVLTADDDAPATAEMTEILNYVRMANSGFLWAQEGRPITLSLIEDLQGELMRGTPLESTSGRLRDTQVMIGRRPGAHNTTPVHASRFVPAPPGDPLRAGVRALVDWLHQDHAGDIDPIIAAGMAHYQFETLHPFRDGNGRLGRFLIVLTLLGSRSVAPSTTTRCCESAPTATGTPSWPSSPRGWPRQPPAHATRCSPWPLRIRASRRRCAPPACGPRTLSTSSTSRSRIRASRCARSRPPSASRTGEPTAWLPS